MKKIVFLLVSFFMIPSCQKETMILNSGLKETSVNTQPPNTIDIRSSMLSICHNTNSLNNSWITIEINANALNSHLSHGDMLPDEDGDGYTKINPCGIGNQDDCSDQNATINPDATEICGNAIDDNCNGETDEGCENCAQNWMIKNLEITTYRNGDLIPEVTDASAWAGLTTGAWCYYENNPANGPIYGKLYNWHAVNDPRGLAPSGYHIATHEEYITLAECLGGQYNPVNYSWSVAGGKMKTTGTLETGTGLWHANNDGATNSSGWSGLPGGWRYDHNGGFSRIGILGYWWCSTASTASRAWTRTLYAGSDLFYSDTNDKRFGFSVRCVKD